MSLVLEDDPATPITIGGSTVTFTVLESVETPVIVNVAFTLAVRDVVESAFLIVIPLITNRSCVPDAICGVLVASTESMLNTGVNVTVVPDFSNFQATMNNLIARSPSFSINKILNEGSFLTSLQEIQAISSLLNEQSLSDKLGLLTQDNSAISYFPQVYGPFCNYGGVNAV
jgi:hypothetical protein